MAAALSNELIRANLIDYVLCFSPSKTVSDSIKETFERVLKRGMSGTLGDVGAVFTYQYLSSGQPERFNNLFKSRVFVIFDEIHHAAGYDETSSNSWGREILGRISQHATYILSMTGTPWRTDKLPIALAQYVIPEGVIRTDYTYGIMEAIGDSVCRVPEINLLDNDQLIVDGESFTSIGSALGDSNLRYTVLLENEKALNQILAIACERLKCIRETHEDAGGLIVAKSVEHASLIYQILCNKFNQTAVIVTYQDANSHAVIEEYRHSGEMWIVSVAMVSEGTDIPRLRVCVHLSHIKTELFFRQVLGRVLRRIPDLNNNVGWLYTFSEPSLAQFARRVQRDIPDTNQIVVRQVETENVAWEEISTKPSIDSTLCFNGDAANSDVHFLVGNKLDYSQQEHGIVSQLNFSLEGDFRQHVFSVFG